MFRVLQNLNSDTNRPIAKNKRKSSAERRRRRLATAAAIEEHAQAQRDAHEAQEEEEGEGYCYCDENDEEFSTKTMNQTEWGDPWDDPLDYEDENKQILDLIAISTEEQITEASRAARTWGTFIDDESSKYDVWRPTLEFLLSR